MAQGPTRQRYACGCCDVYDAEDKKIESLSTDCGGGSNCKRNAALRNLNRIAGDESLPPLPKDTAVHRGFNPRQQ